MLRNRARQESGKITTGQVLLGLALAIGTALVLGTIDQPGSLIDHLRKASQTVTVPAAAAEPAPATSGTVKLSGRVTYGEFADALLVSIDAPRTQTNRDFLVLWMRAESGHSSKVQNNPLNTTWKAKGSRTFNSHGVKHYPNIQTGLDATVKTIRLGHYRDVYTGLRNGNRSVERLARDLARTPWGTGDLVVQMARSGTSPAKSRDVVITGTR